MTARLQSITLLAAAAIALALSWPPAALAVDLSHPRQQRDLTPALRDQLTETISDEASPFLNAEDEKKSRNEPYVDLQPQFEYLPNYGPGGHLVVSAKLGGAEYVPPKSRVGKGTSTGKLKYLVFTYSLVKGKWVELNKPRWETQDLGPKAAKKMTAAAERAEKYKAAQAQAEERKRQKAQKTPAPTHAPAPAQTPATIH
ncbi:MAG TPA: hypothetical protein VN742_06170 [Candidatus Binataceae bacterium]|nr:hypothetical protein [Candidatus Binataceae bacterium]